MLMHVLAAAEPASTTTARADLANMFAVVRASRLAVQNAVPGQSLRIRTVWAVEGRGRLVEVSEVSEFIGEKKRKEMARTGIIMINARGR